MICSMEVVYILISKIKQKDRVNGKMENVTVG
jgi:hypothetical protein